MITNIPPTYSAIEVLRIVREFDLQDCRSLMVIVDDEIDRYGCEDLVILMQACMVMFSRSVVSFGSPG